MRKALIIVDMVKGFTEEMTKDGKCDMYVTGAKALVPKINRLVEQLPADTIIIHVNDNHAPDDVEFEQYPQHCVRGTEEADITDGFKYEGHIMTKIPKTRYDGFYKTNLDMFLKENNIQDVVIVGVVTEVCVLSTALGAVMRDYDVEVNSDCVHPLTGELAQKDVLSLLKDFYGVSITTLADRD